MLSRRQFQAFSNQGHNSIRKRFPRSNLYFIKRNVSDQLLASPKTCLNQISLAAETKGDVAGDFEAGQDKH